MYIAVMNELHDSLDEKDREILRLREEVATLKLLVAKFQQMLYGRKSERLADEDAGQMVMADMLAEVDRLSRQITANEAELIQRKATMVRKPRRDLAGMIPEDLPRVEIVHDLSPYWGHTHVNMYKGLPWKKKQISCLRKQAPWVIFTPMNYCSCPSMG
jgi:hypothetical protein